MSTARSFNGSSDYARNTTGYLSGSSGPFTIMCWMKSASLTQSSVYLTDSSTTNSSSQQAALIYGFVNDGAGHAQVEFFDATTSAWRTNTKITILDTNWHHIAYRYLGAGSEWAFFLDGAKTVINAAFTNTLNSPLGQFSVGAAYGSSASNYFNGSLAEVALWSTNLSDGDIAAIANTNGLTLPTGFPTGLLGYWPLGLASPDTDQSSANHPLTVNGTAIVTGPYAVAPTIGLPSSHTVPILTVQQW